MNLTLTTEDTYESIFAQGINKDTLDKACELAKHNLMMNRFCTEWFNSCSELGIALVDSTSRPPSYHSDRILGVYLAKTNIGAITKDAIALL